MRASRRRTAPRAACSCASPARCCGARPRGGSTAGRRTMLYDQIASLFAFVDERRDQLAVRVQDSPAGGSELEANLPDAPFLVDTVREAVVAHGYTVRLLLHPVVGMRRSPIGAVEAITDARSAPDARVGDPRRARPAARRRAGRGAAAAVARLR